MSDEITVVTGFGRCGSSLVMQMLDAGGFPVYGGPKGYPAYEAPEAAELPDSHRWLTGAQGKAVKVLDIHRHTPPAGRRYRWVWLDRNTVQQARSMLKFARVMFPGVTLTDDPQAEKRLSDSYNADRPVAWRVMGRLGGEILYIQFEDILADPRKVAEAIITFFGRVPHVENVYAMCEAVRPRIPECLPGLLELDLMAERNAAEELAVRFGVSVPMAMRRLRQVGEEARE